MVVDSHQESSSTTIVNIKWSHQPLEALPLGVTNNETNLTILCVDLSLNSSMANLSDDHFGIDETSHYYSYIIVVFTVIGIIVNIGGFAFLSSIRSPSMFHKLLKMLTLSDLCVVIGIAMVFALDEIWDWYNQTLYPIATPYVVPLLQISLTISIYSTIVMSFERYIRIRYICNFRHCSYINKKHFKFYVLCIVGLPTLVYSPRFFEFKLTYSDLRADPHYIQYYIVVLTTLFGTFIPFSCLTFLNFKVVRGLQELGRDSSVAAYSRLRNTNLSRYSHQRRQMAVVQITKEECNHKHCCHCRPANHLGRPVAATAMKANNALRRATTIPIFYSDCGNVVPEHNATGQQGSSEKEGVHDDKIISTSRDHRRRQTHRLDLLYPCTSHPLGHRNASSPSDCGAASDEVSSCNASCGVSTCGFCKSGRICGDSHSSRKKQKMRSGQTNTVGQKGESIRLKRRRHTKDSQERGFHRQYNSAPDDLQLLGKSTINMTQSRQLSGNTSNNEDQNKQESVMSWGLMNSLPNQPQPDNQLGQMASCSCTCHSDRGPGKTRNTLRHTSSQFRNRGNCGRGGANAGNGLNRYRTLGHGENRLTRIAIAIVTLFLLCHGWRLVPTLHDAFVSEKEEDKPFWLGQVVHISHMLICFNSAINFLLYMLPIRIRRRRATPVPNEV